MVGNLVGVIVLVILDHIVPHGLFSFLVVHTYPRMIKNLLNCGSELAVWTNHKSNQISQFLRHLVLLVLSQQKMSVPKLLDISLEYKTVKLVIFVGAVLERISLEVHSEE